MKDKKYPSSLVPLVIDLPPDNGRFTPVLKAGSAQTMKAGLIRLNPGEEIGEHTTETREELIIILEGEGEVFTEQCGRRRVRAGQAAYNPPGTLHNVINTGATTLRYVYVVAGI